MTDIVLNWHSAGFDEVLRSHGIAAGVEAVAQKAAEEMSRTAPRGSGVHMADNIETAQGVDTQGPYTDVGFTTKRFYYWRYVERGTEHMTARPFIRPALSKHYTV